MTVDDVAMTIDEVLADRNRSPLLSNEGPVLQTRYRRTDFAPSLKPAPSASPLTNESLLRPLALHQKPQSGRSDVLTERRSMTLAPAEHGAAEVSNCRVPVPVSGTRAMAHPSPT